MRVRERLREIERLRERKRERDKRPGDGERSTGEERTGGQHRRSRRRRLVLGRLPMAGGSISGVWRPFFGGSPVREDPAVLGVRFSMSFLVGSTEG
jgi:hypothetical protein